MEKHINTVATLQIVYSSIGLVIGGIVFFIFHFIGEFSGDHDANFVLSIIANVVITMVLILSLPGIIAGMGLYKRKEWARILTIIISIFNLLSFPLGTALGVYSIWALSQSEIADAFKNKNLSY